MDNYDCDEEFGKICDETLALIPTYGVTDEALLEACSRLHLEDSLYKFPRGIRDVLEHMYNALICHISSEYNDKNREEIPRVRDKILWLLHQCVGFHAGLPECRLLMKAVVAYCLVPKNTCFAGAMAFKIADEIWHLAQDSSTDFSYYTKRITLSTVYIMSMLHMVEDTSDNYAATYDFMRRRVDNVVAFHKMKGRFQSLLSKSLGILNVRFDR
ncbi:COQ9 family protein [Candidatus Anaplasma sp. TIGMIC]|uniref:COQ9 family protein n=1 Tax=Candidatus Anaplasma sp. TIGMIC TaxID=3020713 RepID=UPI00232EA1A1|nr:COQ9 family protein [Candidatus Anaplasma sp. TIGMIC]MDB1135438.1 COQ9 family protein [Candidatus Anaplasma sp. TIGMIC]